MNALENSAVVAFDPMAIEVEEFEAGDAQLHAAVPITITITVSKVTLITVTFAREQEELEVGLL